MTKDQIIAAAKECYHQYSEWHIDIERFAAIIAKTEREACIAIVESYKVSVGNSRSGELVCKWTMENLREIRDEIRARGDMK